MSDYRQLAEQIRAALHVDISLSEAMIAGDALDALVAALEEARKERLDALDDLSNVEAELQLRTGEVAAHRPVNARKTLLDALPRVVDPVTGIVYWRDDKGILRPRTLTRNGEPVAVEQVAGWFPIQFQCPACGVSFTVKKETSERIFCSPRCALL